jgi:hypothetical protein
MVETGTRPAPTDCPRFYNCNAPICPLDERWREAVHLGGERVCFYLRATGKQGAAEQYAADPVFQICRERLPLVAAKHPSIGKAVEKAAAVGFQGENLRKSQPG